MSGKKGGFNTIVSFFVGFGKDVGQKIEFAKTEIDARKTRSGDAVNKNRGHNPPKGTRKDPKPQSAEVPPEPVSPPEPPFNLQQKVARKFQLEQMMAGVVGEETGLVRLLDSMLYYAHRKDGSVFQFYAQAYVWKYEKLGPLLQEYDALIGDSEAFRERHPMEEDTRMRILERPIEDHTLYTVLLQIGDELTRERLMDDDEVGEDRLVQWEDKTRGMLIPFSRQEEQNENL